MLQKTEMDDFKNELARRVKECIRIEGSALKELIESKCFEHKKIAVCIDHYVQSHFKAVLFECGCYTIAQCVFTENEFLVNCFHVGPVKTRAELILIAQEIEEEIHGTTKQ